MKLRFTPYAVEDIAGIADYISERNPEAPLRVRAAIYESLQNLALFPYIGRVQQTKGCASSSRQNIGTSSTIPSMKTPARSSF